MYDQTAIDNLLYNFAPPSDRTIVDAIKSLGFQNFEYTGRGIDTNDNPFTEAEWSASFVSLEETAPSFDEVYAKYQTLRQAA